MNCPRCKATMEKRVKENTITKLLSGGKKIKTHTLYYCFKCGKVVE